jgi:hypothetical protein
MVCGKVTKVYGKSCMEFKQSNSGNNLVSGVAVVFFRVRWRPFERHGLCTLAVLSCVTIWRAFKLQGPDLTGHIHLHTAVECELWTLKCWMRQSSLTFGKSSNVQYRGSETQH